MTKTSINPNGVFITKKKEGKIRYYVNRNKLQRNVYYQHTDELQSNFLRAAHPQESFNGNIIILTVVMSH